MLRMRSPGALLVVVAHVGAALAVLVVLIALRMPVTGVGFVAAGTQIEVAAGGAVLARLAPAATVEFRSPAGAMRQTAGELVADHSPDGSPTTIAAWFAARDRLTAIAATSPATLTLPDGRRLVLIPQPRGVGDLSRDVWLLLVQGCAFALLGVWLAALRPRHWGARMFLVSCLGLVAASFSGALYDARELSADGALLRTLQVVNFAGSMVSAAGLLALYVCSPRALLRPGIALAGVGVAAAWGVAAGLGWLPLASFYAGLLTLTAGFIVVFGLQWRGSRHDPAARAALRWVGVTSLIGTGQLAVAMAAPQFLGIAAFGGDGMTILPLFIVYGSIAFGIGSNRLFDLDRWTYRIILGAVATLGFLIADIALVTLLHLGEGIAFALALLVVGFLYLPLRALIWRRIVGRPPLRDSEMFQIATEVAFAAHPAERRDGWRALLRRLFDPLEIATYEGTPEIPALVEEGAALVMPATADDTALRLGFRAGGRRLFGPAQVALAVEVLALMRRAEAARAEYARGVGEERRRIARDLHDEVCAVLLTSLHREDVSAVRGDVRTAMADIRTIIAGLTGERRALDQVVADLRYETAGRLAAAQIALDWPLPGVPLAPRLLDYPVYKALIASHREIVSNIVKHAGAARVTVAVAEDAEGLAIDVADDGGAAFAPRPARGHGLANLHLRLAEVGGSVALSPAAPGCRVLVTIPLD